MISMVGTGRRNVTVTGFEVTDTGGDGGPCSMGIEKRVRVPVLIV
jgi:hypothetical protein